MDAAELRAQLGRYPWYHRIDVGDGIVTPGVERYERYQEPVLRTLRLLPVAGRRVLDVGCRDGLFAFEAERLGAREVVGIDNNLSAGAVELLIPALGSRVRMLELNVLDARREELGAFDIVVFAGVLYHLRYPIWSLHVVADLLVEDGLLLLETAVMHGRGDLALLWCPTGLDGPYDQFSPAFFNPRGLADTLTSLGLAIESLELHADPDARPTSLWRRVVHRRPRIARATAVCRKGAVDAELDAYWNGRHEINRWS